MRTSASLVLALTASVVGCAPATSPPTNESPGARVAPAKHGTEDLTPEERAAADGIRPEALAAHIRFLADDLLEGREPGTRGFELGSRYVASELQAMGLVPAGDSGTFFQKVELTGSKLVSASLEITGGGGPPLKLVRDVEFIARKEHGDLTGELVFVGHGLDVPEYHYDDFAGVDLHGKIAVRLGHAPRSDRPEFFPPLASAIFGDSDRVTADLKRRGAIAVISVQTPESIKLTPFARVVKLSRFETMQLADAPGRLPAAALDPPAFDRLLKKAGRPETWAQLAESASQHATPPFSLGLEARLHVEVTQRSVTSENVVGYVPSDPASPAKDEMVMYGAHLDHMGVGEEVNGDKIYNGASDDAAGVSSLLETARAFTDLSRRHPLRRRILFLFVTGEERGLLGSKHYADHPTVPMHDIVADIDIDDAYPTAPIKDVVPLGADESSLSVDSERAARALGLEVGRDPHPEELYFVRSDNYSFVKKGVPAVQVLRGVLGLSKEEREATEAFWKGRYHQPQDEYEPNRDWRPFADFTRFGFLLGLSIAQRSDRPKWNEHSFFRRFPEKL